MVGNPPAAAFRTTARCTARTPAPLPASERTPHRGVGAAARRQPCLARHRPDVLMAQSAGECKILTAVGLRGHRAGGRHLSERQIRRLPREPRRPDRRLGRRDRQRRVPQSDARGAGRARQSVDSNTGLLGGLRPGLHLDPPRRRHATRGCEHLCRADRGWTAAPVSRGRRRVRLVAGWPPRISHHCAGRSAVRARAGCGLSASNLRCHGGRALPLSTVVHRWCFHLFPARGASE